MDKQEARTVIDIHTHVFNALCLPLEGIILEYLTGKNPKPTLFQKTAAEALARILERLALSVGFADASNQQNGSNM